MGKTGSGLCTVRTALLTQCRLQELCFVGNEEDVRSRSHGGYFCSLLIPPTCALQPEEHVARQTPSNSSSKKNPPQARAFVHLPLSRTLPSPPPPPPPPPPR